jgi:transcriptional regulator with XRE-family HTH domain
MVNMMMVMERREMSVGANIKRLREARSWSVRKFAERSGVHPSSISLIERDLRPSPGLDLLGKLADALEVTVDDLRSDLPGTLTPPPSRSVGPVVLVPVVNVTLAAGRSVYGETVEAAPVPARLAQGRELVASKVAGDCMEPEVRSGDVAIIDVSDRAPREGDLVAVLMEDGGMLVKRFQRDTEGLPVLLDNKGGVYRPNGAKIQGVIVHVGRSYR